MLDLPIIKKRLRNPTQEEIREMIKAFDYWEDKQAYLPDSVRDRVDFFFVHGWSAVTRSVVECDVDAARRFLINRLMRRER